MKNTNEEDKVINANSVFIFLIDLLIGQLCQSDSVGQDGQIGKIGQSGWVVWVIRVTGGRNCSLFLARHGMFLTIRCFPILNGVMFR